MIELQKVTGKASWQRYRRSAAGEPECAGQLYQWVQEILAMARSNQYQRKLEATTGRANVQNPYENMKRMQRS